MWKWFYHIWLGLKKLSFLAPGNYQQRDVRDVTEIFSCASHTVSDVITNSSPVECATVCLARPDCVMFAMGRVGGDPSVCAVTNGTRSDVDVRVEYERLYIVVHRQECQWHTMNANPQTALYRNRVIHVSPISYLPSPQIPFYPLI